MASVRISRRTVLQGLGTALALPWLEAMVPAAPAPARAAQRLAFLYVPNGIHMADWTPQAEGAGFELPWIAEPLTPFKDHLTFLTGLTCDKARPHGDGPGDHARAMAAYLTGCQPRKTNGADIQAGISVDQLAAQHVGKATRLPSLELGCDAGRDSGNCDSGYSCAYSNNLSWRGAATPNPKEVNPRLVFERLFGSAGPGGAGYSAAQRNHFRRSILDFVAEDARQLQARLGQHDRRKLDEYLTAVRQVETQLARAQQSAPRSARGPRAAGIPADYQEQVRLLCDLIVLAFQTDQTRVTTFVLANEGSNRNYKAIGVTEGHHSLSHHGNDPHKHDKLRRINRFHVAQLAYLVGKLQGVKEGDRTLLDNCLLVYGSGNSDGNRHNHDNLPTLLVGKGGGTLQGGRHLRFPKETPLCNLWLALLQHLDVPATSFGDCTGILEV